MAKHHWIAATASLLCPALLLCVTSFLPPTQAKSPNAPAATQEAALDGGSIDAAIEETLLDDSAFVARLEHMLSLHYVYGGAISDRQALLNGALQALAQNGTGGAISGRALRGLTASLYGVLLDVGEDEAFDPPRDVPPNRHIVLRYDLLADGAIAVQSVRNEGEDEQFVYTLLRPSAQSSFGFFITASNFM